MSSEEKTQEETVNKAARQETNQSPIEQKADADRYKRGWRWANLIGWAIIYLIQLGHFIVEAWWPGLAERLFYVSPDIETIAEVAMERGREFALHAVIYYSICGLVLGAAQWAVLRKRLTEAGWWVFATIIGSAVGMTAGWVGFWAFVAWQSDWAYQDIGRYLGRGLIASSPVTFLAGGLVVSIAQYLELRRPINKLGRWVAASLIAWIPILGANQTGAVLDRLLEIQPVGRRLYGRLAEMAMMLALAGGLMLGFAIRDQRVAQNEEVSGIVELPGQDQIEGGVLSLHWTPDGGQLYSGSSDGSVIIWDAETYEVIRSLEFDEGGAQAWSDDLTLFASVGWDDPVSIWNVQTAERLHFYTNEENTSHVALSPDGKQFATSHYGVTLVRNSDMGEVLFELNSSEPNYLTGPVAWSPDGNYIATGASDIRIWDAETGELVTEFGLNLAGRIDRNMTWSPDGRMITDYGTVYDVTSGEVVNEFRAAIGVGAVGWSPDSTMLATAHAWGEVKIIIWDLATGVQLHSVADVCATAASQGVSHIAWSPDGETLAFHCHNRVRIWDIPPSPEAASSGSASPPQKLAREMILEGHLSSVQGVAWSPDGQSLASLELDGRVILWDGVTGKQLRIFTAHNIIPREVIWSPDGVMLAIAGDVGPVKIYEASTGKLLKELGSDVGGNISWSPDGTLIARATTNEVEIWDFNGGELIRIVGELSNWYDWYEGVSWSPDGSLLVAGDSNGVLTVWDRNGELLSKLRGHTKMTRGIAWSPDGSMLASTSSDTTVRIWDIKTGEQLQVLKKHRDSTYSVAWSPDGSMLASAGADREIIIWDVSRGKPLKTLRDHTDYVHSVVWSPDGTRLASASSDRTVRIWPAP